MSTFVVVARRYHAQTAIEELKRTHRGTVADERPDLTPATVDEIDDVDPATLSQSPNENWAGRGCWRTGFYPAWLCYWL
jgi:hypothetical protein